MTPAEIEEDRQLRAMVALVDAQREQIDMLQDATALLEAKVAMRSELDVIVAQELRSPLSVVTESLAELQVLKPGDADYPDVVERAVRNATYLTEIIDDLLRPWRGDTPIFDRRTLEVLPVRLLIETARQAFDEKELSRLTIDNPNDVLIRTSPPRVTGILINVIDQALRFGNEGPVRLRVHRDDDDVVRIEVSDDGQELSGTDTESLFQPFGPDMATNKNHRGIGLYLVRMLARSLGGEISLGVRDGGGTTATIELPQRRSGDGDPAAG